jgi:hypothetical protein
MVGALPDRVKGTNGRKSAPRLGSRETGRPVPGRGRSLTRSGGRGVTERRPEAAFVLNPVASTRPGQASDSSFLRLKTSE